jgi:thiol-disulfide isomerase/thioredoxin/tetratricopeptide (TPR) repeat protein
VAITTFLLLFVCAIVARAQAPVYPCEAPAAVRQELLRLEFPNDAAMTAEERYAKRQAILSALLERYPDDLFVQTGYQDFMRRRQYVTGVGIDSLITEYQALLAKHPERPEYLYLYGRALLHVRTAEAQTYLEKALVRAPNFAWPHLELVKIYESSRFRDPAKVEAHLEAFMKTCPGSLEPYGYFRGVEDKVLLRQSLAHLKKLLEGRTDDDALDAHTTLWDLEFRLAPTSEYAPARERVAADVARLRALNRIESLDWFDVLHYGYKTLGDDQGQKWVADQLLVHFPQSQVTVRHVMDRWQQENPRPKEGSAPDQLEAYNRAQVHATDDWIERWPNAPGPRVVRFHAMTDLKDVSPVDLEAAAEGYMAAMEKNQDIISTKPSAPMQVAQEYLKRGIQLAGVPELVEHGLSQSLELIQREPRSDMDPPEESKRNAANWTYFIRWDALTTLANAYLKLNQPEKAREALFQVEAFLGENKASRSATEGGRRAYLDQTRTYWEMMASVAEAQGGKLDALAYYQNALSFPHQHSGLDKKDDDPAKAARLLWRSLGGTEEGWLAWVTEHAPPTSAGTGEIAWEKPDKPLPDFNLSDLAGRSWRLPDLKGKVTFVNVWTTFCGPCRAELPFVEKLYQQMKEGQDVLVLTLNGDENPGLIEPFMRQNKYTFPVLPALSYLEHLDSTLAFPQNWIVDRNGVLRMETLGFGYNGEEWLKNVVRTIEASRARPSPAGQP